LRTFADVCNMDAHTELVCDSDAVAYRKPTGFVARSLCLVTQREGYD